MTGQPKSARLTQLVDRLRADLGPGFFTEVTHWDADLEAAGLARPDDTRVLVYLRAYPPPDIYFECEIPAPGSESDPCYQVTNSGTYVTYEQVLAVVRDHLTR